MAQSIDKAKQDAKKVWDRIGWLIYLDKARDILKLPQEEVENHPTEPVLEIISRDNATIV